MAYRSLTPDILPDILADRKASVRIGQYRIGEKAIYVPCFPQDQYIPFSSIRRAWTQKAELGMTGCCGKTVPIVRLRIQFDGGAKGLLIQNYTLDTQEQANKLLSLLVKGCPTLETTPPFDRPE